MADVDQAEGERRGRQWIGWAALLGILSAFFAWWAWEVGAYFGRVFYPGEIIILVLLGILMLSTPLRSRFGGAPALALYALLGLAAWILLSILWTPTTEVAIDDTHKVLLYAALFVVGIFLVGLLGERRELALLPIGLAGIVVGIATVIAFGHGTAVSSYLHEDGTLRYPLGYRNANAAFWLISAWPLVALALRRQIPWPLRALMLAGVTMLIELAVLSQSRGSVPAAVIAFVVLIALCGKGLKAALFVLLAAIPAVPAVPTLLRVFQHNAANAGSIPLLHDSAEAIALSTLGSLALAAIFLGLVEPRLRIGKRSLARLSRAAAAVAILVVLVGGALLVSRHGGPVSFVNQRISELSQGTPNLHSQGSRFGFNLGSNRGDIWRVAFDEWKENPIRGGGAGSWQIEYLRRRHAETAPHDPHSVEMLMLSEFGLPGIILFATFVIAAVIAAARSRRLGRAGPILIGGALAAGAQWFIQASYDWLFFYPGVTAPAIFLLGVAAATPLGGVTGRLRGALRLAIPAALGVTVVGAALLYLSALYEDRARSEAPANPAAAYADYRRAASLDPFAVEPLIAKATVALGADDKPIAIGALREALSRESDDFNARYLLGISLLHSNPASARRELLIAQRLDPKFALRAPLAQSRAALVRARARAKAACCTPGK